MWADDLAQCFSTAAHFYIEKIPWYTTNQKYFSMEIFSLITTIQSLNLFTVTQCETWVCLDAHKADEGGIEGGNKLTFLWQTVEFYYFFNQLNEIG